MLVNRIVIGSAAFGLSFGLSFLAERNVQRSLLTGLIAPGAYAGAVALDDRQKRQVKLVGQAIAGQLQAAEQRQVELQQALLTATAEKQAAETSLSYLQTEIGQIQARIQTQKQQEQDLGQAIATLEGRKQQLEASFQQLQDRVGGLTTQEKEIQQAIAATSQERQSLAIEVARLNQELNQLQTQLTEVSEQRLQLSSEVATLQTTKQLLESNAADLQTQIQALERSRQTLTASLTEISAIDLQPLKSEIQVLFTNFTAQKGELTQALGDFLTELTALSDEPKRIQADFSGMKLQLNTEITSLQDSEKLLKSETQGLQHQIQSLQQFSQTLTSSLTEFPKLVEPLKLNLQELSVDLKNQRLDLEEARKDLSKIASKILESDEKVILPPPILPPLPPEWQDFINQLSDDQYLAVRAILKQDNEELKQIANNIPVMPKVLIAEINQCAQETIGENIFDLSSSTPIPPVYEEEYIELLKLAIEVRKPSAISSGATPTKSWKCILDLEYEQSANSLVLSSDGKTLISAHGDGNINFWNLDKREIANTLKGVGSISSIAIHPNEEFLVSGGADSKVNLWNLKTGELVGALFGHGTRINSVAISLNGEIIASGSSDKTIKLWDFKTRKLIKTLQGNFSLINAVAFKPGLERLTLVDGSHDKTMRIWNLDLPKPKSSPLFDHSGQVLSLAFTSDGETLVSGDSEGMIRIRNLVTQKNHMLIGHQGRALVAVSPDNKLIISGSDDCQIRIWDLQSRDLIATIPGHRAKICAIAFGSESDTFVTSSADQTIKVWRYS